MPTDPVDAPVSDGYTVRRRLSAINRLTTARLALEVLELDIRLTPRQRGLVEAAVEAIDQLATDVRLQGHGKQTYFERHRLKTT